MSLVFFLLPWRSRACGANRPRFLGRCSPLPWLPLEVQDSLLVDFISRYSLWILLSWCFSFWTEKWLCLWTLQIPRKRETAPCGLWLTVTCTPRFRGNNDSRDRETSSRTNTIEALFTSPFVGRTHHDQSQSSRQYDCVTSFSVPPLKNAGVFGGNRQSDSFSKGDVHTHFNIRMFNNFRSIKGRSWSRWPRQILQ